MPSTAAMNKTLDINTTDSDVIMQQCDSEDMARALNYSGAQLTANIMVTLSVLAMFVGTRTIFEKIRRQLAEITVVVIGAGPIGLTSALIAANCKRVTKLIVYEELSKFDVEQKSYQIAIKASNVAFLRKYGIDFDNLEGLWSEGCFYTRVGIYIEYIINILPLHETNVEFNFRTKLNKDNIRLVDTIPGRKLVICCDGNNGQAARALGINDEYVQQSSGVLGSLAVIDRNNQTLVPIPERRVHNLSFDLTAYGGNMYDEDGTSFSLKIFGNSRHRYLLLAVMKSDTQVVKAMKTFLDRSMMRNIFLKCFNTYKASEEASISDSYCLNNMKFNPRLTEIKLNQRIESVAYIDDCDLFVVTEGDASRTYSVSTGMDINVGLKGLTSLQPFIERIVWAETEHSIMSALIYKMEHSDKVSKDFLKHGLKDYIFT